MRIENDKYSYFLQIYFPNSTETQLSVLKNAEMLDAVKVEMCDECYIKLTRRITMAGGSIVNTP